ncbi:hypothetical protein B4U79_19005, partial [Dinothrombium tinctorium]
NDLFIFAKSLHNGHIIHCEFNPVDSNLFVTASVDRRVKIWDLRMLSKNAKNLFEEEFKYPLNAASFSPHNGRTLIVSDNHEKINVYSGPNWVKEWVISHKHHQFQEISAIKPAFHPNLNLIVIGSSSKNSEISSLDIIDLDAEASQIKLTDGKQGALSINLFNSSADTIVSARRAYLLFWKKAVSEEIKYINMLSRKTV